MPTTLSQSGSTFGLRVGDDATWCALAKYSLDHGSGDRCGTALITNGMLVQPLDRIVFSAPEDTTLLIRASNGFWTILEPLSSVDPDPAHVPRSSRCS